MQKQPSDKARRLFQDAMNELNNGRPTKAIRLFEKVRKLWCENADIWYLQGLAFGKLGELEDVKRVSLRALALDSNHYGALCNLANAYMSRGEKEDALDCYKRALLIKPDAPDVLDNYGRALSMLGRREEAIEHFRTALRGRQGFAPAHASLGRAYREAGEPKEAMDEFRCALEHDPDNVDAHLGMGHLYSGLGGLPRAELHFKKALELSFYSVEANNGLANIERYKGNYQKALDYLSLAEEQAGAEDPNQMAMRADVLERAGRSDEAFAVLTQLDERSAMSSVAVSAYARLCHKFEVCDKALLRVEESLDSIYTDEIGRKGLCYSAGDVLDRCGRYDEAFGYYKRANEVVDIRLNREVLSGLTEQLMRGFERETAEKYLRSTVASRRPIFIVGMPRSGTSLTEQILASHPDVYGAGELGELQAISLNMGGGNAGTPGAYIDCLAGLDQSELDGWTNKYLDVLDSLDTEATVVTDKLPHNFQRMGLISLLFPDARVIHCRRNPADTCLSIYFQDFIWSHDYASNLSDLAFAYNEYDRLMRFWEAELDYPVHTVQYEELVSNQEYVSRSLLEFCGLEWDDEVLAYHVSDRAVATASYDQVRRPMYKTSQNRWKNYEKHLDTLISEFSDEVTQYVR